MNAPVLAPRRSRAPQRRKISLSEFRRMWETGVFPDYPDLELIEGDIYEMPSDGPRTISWNAAINRWLARALPDDCVLVPDKTLALGEKLGAPKPDFYIYPAAIKLADLRPADVLLAIEVSTTTVAYDRDLKAPLYAKAGVREHWRIECEARRIVAYRLDAEGYGEPTPVACEDTATALLIPGLKLRLADLALPE